MGYDVTAEAQARGEQRRSGNDARPVPVLVPQHGARPGRRRRRGRRPRARRSGVRQQLRRGVSDAVRVEVAHDELVAREHPPALPDGLAASAPVGHLETSRGRGAPAVPRNPLLPADGSRTRTRAGRSGQRDENAAVHDDRDGHARTRDLFEAHAQGEACDSIGRVVPEGKPGRGAAAAVLAGCQWGVEDGARFGVALCKVQPSAVAERGELERGD